MEYRQLGRSGLKVPALSFGTGTFGGEKWFAAWGNTDVPQARELISICLDAGLNLFDSADVYSAGKAETILGAALKGRPRHQYLISTKASFRAGEGPNDVGSSRIHLTRTVDAALQRLGTDHIDLFQLHGMDAVTPVEETLGTLADLVRAGKLRYLGVSNYSGWHLMKALATSDRHGWPRYVAHQAYYSLIGRDFEWELMPLALDQGVGTVVWSPLGWGRLTGKIRRGEPLPHLTRLPETAKYGPPVPEELLFRVVDALDDVARETGKSVPQVALNWLMQRPSVATVVIGARDAVQLRDNLGAIGWNLSADHMTRLEQASAVTPGYPYWHQRGFKERNPFPVSIG